MIHIALTGSTSILKKMTPGKKRIVSVLKKIVETAMDSYNIEGTVVPDNSPFQGELTFSDRGKKVVLKTTIFRDTNQMKYSQDV